MEFFREMSDPGDSENADEELKSTFLKVCQPIN